MGAKDLGAVANWTPNQNRCGLQGVMNELKEKLMTTGTMYGDILASFEGTWSFDPSFLQGNTYKTEFRLLTATTPFFTAIK